MSEVDIGAYAFWVLDAVWQFPLRLRRLFLDSKSLSEHVNMRALEVSTSDRLATLHFLLTKGFIDLCYESGNPCDFELTAKMVKESVTATNQPEIRILPLGGAVWTQIAKPNWTRYTEVRAAPEEKRVAYTINHQDGNELMLFKASDVNRLRNMILTYRHRYMRTYRDITTIECFTERPWNVSSWLSLPNGYCCTTLFSGRQASINIRDTRLEPFEDKWREVGFNPSLCDQVIVDERWVTRVIL